VITLSTELIDVVADFVGIVGVGMTLLAYFLLQIDKILSTSRLYSLLNIAGAILILYSLYYNWNTPAVIMELAWFGISLYGLIRHYNMRPPS
jgi:membrane associated rhomboid family serine protease